MLAQDLMTREPAVIPATYTLREAAELMLTRGVGVLPVVDHVVHRQLLGMLSDRDLVLRAMALGHGESAKVHEHMSRPPFATVAAYASIPLIAEQMMTYKVRRIPVLDGDGCVVGIIGLSDLVRRGGADGARTVCEVMDYLSHPGALAP
jgi:CBS domain-containing protein